jgi:hypothetical protein
MNRFKVGDRVEWRAGTRRYVGSVKHASACGRACNVTSREGLVWLLPTVELARVT